MADAGFESLLTHTAIVYRRSLTGAKNRFNVPSETIAVSSASIDCLIQPLGETLEFDKRGKKEYATMLGFFLITDSILVDDIIEFNSKKYIIIGIEDAAGQAHHIEAFMGALGNVT